MDTYQFTLTNMKPLKLIYYNELQMRHTHIRALGFLICTLTRLTERLLASATSIPTGVGHVGQWGSIWFVTTMCIVHVDNVVATYFWFSVTPQSPDFHRAKHQLDVVERQMCIRMLSCQYRLKALLSICPDTCTLNHYLWTFSEILRCYAAGEKVSATTVRSRPPSLWRIMHHREA